MLELLNEMGGGDFLPALYWKSKDKVLQTGKSGEYTQVPLEGVMTFLGNYKSGYANGERGAAYRIVHDRVAGIADAPPAEPGEWKRCMSVEVELDGTQYEFRAGGKIDAGFIVNLVLKAVEAAGKTQSDLAASGFAVAPVFAVQLTGDMKDIKTQRGTFFEPATGTLELVANNNVAEAPVTSDDIPFDVPQTATADF